MQEVQKIRMYPRIIITLFEMIGKYATPFTAKQLYLV